MILALIGLALLPQQQPSRELPPAQEGSIVLFAAWSKDGKQLVYSGGHLDDPKKFDPQKIELHLVNADGTGRRDIPGQAFAGDFEPHNKSLIIASIRDGGRSLYRCDLASEKVERLTDVQRKCGTPAVSPSTGQIAYEMEEDGELHIYVMNADGSSNKKLVGGPGKTYTPIWSQDGKQVVYYRELGDHKDQIYVIDADGSNERHISDSAQHNFYPAFLPNGDISYTNPLEPGKNRVVIVSADGKAKSVWPYPTHYLRWSPDGKKAAFIAGGFGHNALYVADTDGSNPVKVSN